MSVSVATSQSVGLTTAEVNQRLTDGLVNAQNYDSSRSLWSIIRGNVVNLFNGVVGGCFILLAILGQWKDTLFGFALLSNLLIGIFQEYSAKRTLDRLAVLNQPLARVRRDGKDTEIRLELIVLDDILLLRAGDQILADGSVIESKGLEVDESLLTGESEPVAKRDGESVLSGCGVVAGSAVVQVTKVGAETYASKITAEARRFSLVKSELRNSLNRLIAWITWLLFPLVVIIINGQIHSAGGWEAASKGKWIEVAVRSTSSIVSMIPQGLILITSISFAIAAVTLTKKRVLLQELPAVEGLARVDVLCTDKTGTLTDGAVSFFYIHQLEKDFVKGQTESILSLFAHDHAANATAISMASVFPISKKTIESTVPFSSARKWSALKLRGEKETWVFGAPELVLDDANKSNSSALDEAKKLATAGYRTLVLAVTRKNVTPESGLPNGIVPVALVTFTENIRDDAAQTLHYFREQGVRVLIISGDNPATVGAIAKKAGLDEPEPIDARTLPKDQAQLADILEAHRVFGRVTPEQKREMMAALQSRGKVVAMIGDGVNDALALKHADLGIAMGSGAPATKAVSNLVLLDGRFSSLPGVVAEGRKVIANIERLSRLFLTKTVWAMLLALTFGLTYQSFPFLPRQLSAVDAFTIGVPSFLLAMLPNSRRYLPGFLKRSLMFCIPAGLVTAAATLSLGMLIRGSSDWNDSQAQTAVSILLGILGLWVLATLARPLDFLRIAIILGMVVMGMLTFGVPFVAEFFGFVALTQQQLGVTAIVAALGIVATGVISFFVDNRNREALATA